MTIIFSGLIAYLLGSVNTSIIVSKLFGSGDIRKQGSGNAGATNTLRVLGKKAAVFVVIGDGLKGFLAVIIARWLSHLFTHGDIASYVAAVCVMLGHVFPVFFGFKGGKGIMTSIAVIFTLSPVIGGILVALFVVIVAIFNYISLGSVTCSVLYPILVLVFYWGNIPFLVSAIIMAVIAVVKHKSNIVRLVNGNESKFIKKK